MLRLFFTIFVLLFVCNSSLNAQISQSNEIKEFSIFRMDDISKMKGLEPILKDNLDLEMVRFDYQTHIVFFVTKPGFVLDNTSLNSLCGTYFQDIKCFQIGSLGINAPDFEKIKNCN